MGPPQPDNPAASMGDYCAAVLRTTAEFMAAGPDADGRSFDMIAVSRT